MLNYAIPIAITTVARKDGKPIAYVSGFNENREYL